MMPPATPSKLPTGTVTFLFTDMEGSTLLLQRLGDDYLEVIETHNTLVRNAIEGHRGIEMSTEGDSFFAVFASANDAVEAAMEAQKTLAAHSWPPNVELRVRMGIHTGSATLSGSNYVGLDVHRAARIAATAHGGQTVMSASTAALVERELPEGATLRGLGKHRLKDLLDPETIFQINMTGLVTEFPALRSLDAIPNNLPLQLTSFVGRERELSAAARLLGGTRILTLTGPGGTGKTRLALQLAAEVADTYPDGVHFVALASVTDPEYVPAAILNAAGIQASAKESPTDWLLAHMRTRRLLMVLDNFEQLLEAAPLIGDMARAAPGSRFLVTSRAPLHIQGEQEMAVPTLGLPPAGFAPDPLGLLNSEGIRLFVERASAASPAFSLTEANAGAVAELVSRLDGLPLAIELVASRIKLFPAQTILERLSLQTLQSGSRDLPPRQQTLTNTIDWSYDLLDDACRRLFERMSVFAGGARLDEIETICGPDLGAEVTDTLGKLLDHSLVQTAEASGQARFRLLHVLREYAAERLRTDPQKSEIQQRHAETYAELAEQAAGELYGPNRRQRLDELDADHDNLRAALRWAIEQQETNLATRIIWAAWRFWQARGYLHDARRLVTEVLEMPEGDPRLRAKALEACGGIDWWRGAMGSSMESYRQALTIQREIGDPAEIANALYNLALGTNYADDPVDDPIELLDEAERLYEGIGSVGGLADVNWGRGNIAAYGHTDLENGRRHFGRSIEQYRQAGNEFGLGWALFEYGDTSRRLGDFETSRRSLREGLGLLYGHGDLSAVVLFLAALAGLAYDLDRRERAGRLAGVVHALRQTTGADIVIHSAIQAGELIDELRQDTGALAEVFEEGTAMDLEEAVAYALEEGDEPDR
jgi:predicted ATPase/class 3 adenylate cyclase